MDQKIRKKSGSGIPDFLKSDIRFSKCFGGYTYVFLKVSRHAIVRLSAATMTLQIVIWLTKTQLNLSKKRSPNVKFSFLMHQSLVQSIKITFRFESEIFNPNIQYVFNVELELL